MDSDKDDKVTHSGNSDKVTQVDQVSQKAKSMGDHCLVETCEGGRRRSELISSQLTFLSLQRCQRGQKSCENHSAF